MLVVIVYPPITIQVRQPLFSLSLNARRHDRFFREKLFFCATSCRAGTDERVKSSICQRAKNQTDIMISMLSVFLPLKEPPFRALSNG
jgi:hypothetical protein